MKLILKTSGRVVSFGRLFRGKESNEAERRGGVSVKVTVQLTRSVPASGSPSARHVGRPADYRAEDYQQTR